MGLDLLCWLPGGGLADIYLRPVLPGACTLSTMDTPGMVCLHACGGLGLLTLSCATPRRAGIKGTMAQ